MVIFVFGNENLKADFLPLKILPKLKKSFPAIDFKVLDPNEDWDIPEELVILDIAHGIKDIHIFNNLKYFSQIPHITMHDFDALTNLRYLKKLGKLKKIKIIGIPPTISQKKALNKVSVILSSTGLSKNETHSSCTDHTP